MNEKAEAKAKERAESAGGDHVDSCSCEWSQHNTIVSKAPRNVTYNLKSLLNV